MVIEEPLDNFMYQFVGGKAEDAILDNFPSPDYELINTSNLVDPEGRLRISLQMSRGCPMKCGYCPYSEYYNEKIEFRDVDKVIEDIKGVLKYNPDIIQFRDQYFTADRQRVIDFCKKVKEQGLNFKWTCETRIDNIDGPLVDIMCESGMQQMCFGVESAEEGILDSYGRKMLTFAELKQKIDYINSKGAQTLGFYIVGFPDDGWDTIVKTLESALNLNTSFAKFSVYEQCVLDEEFQKTLTPEVFERLQNLVDIEDNSKLTREEKVFAANLFSMIYAMRDKKLEKAFVLAKEEINGQQKKLSELLPLGTDIDAICQYIRTNRGN